MSGSLKRTGVTALAVVFVVVLVAALLAAPPPDIALRAAVEARMDESGVKHPVTAVLLNFRGYDTLLEVGVLLLALIAMLAVSASREDAREPMAGSPDPVLRTLASIAVPVMLLASVYLLWAGAFRPGGAFQAGAVLAAAAVLQYLAGMTRGWAAPGKRLRFGLAAGFLVFIGVAAAQLTGRALLQFPPAWAGSLILLIEAALTASLGLILAGLFLFVSREAAGSEASDGLPGDRDPELGTRDPVHAAGFGPGAPALRGSVDERDRDARSAGMGQAGDAGAP
jgi:multisubunit Na+/H+ antiporter MnhB subunit